MITYGENADSNSVAQFEAESSSHAPLLLGFFRNIVITNNA